MTAARLVRLFEGDRPVAALAADDRRLSYGDGLFETMRVHAGTLPWWDAHWARLAHGATRLGIALPDARQARSEALALFDDGVDGVLKLLLGRGGGARGYAPPQDAEPRWLLARHPLPAPAPSPPLQVIWCDTRLSVQPALAGIKHCNRLEQVLARAECVAAGAGEGLMLDTDGNVVAATSANLFVLREGRWFTPPVDRCGVAGTCRAVLVEALAAGEARLQRGDVDGADAVFLCNAVRGILPVVRLGPRAWELHPELARARAALGRHHPGFAPGQAGQAAEAG